MRGYWETCEVEGAEIQMSRVGQPYKSRRSAEAYATRTFTGDHVGDRDQWIIKIQMDDDGWWCYIGEVIS